jgi:hypothetical protein
MIKIVYQPSLIQVSWFISLFIIVSRTAVLYSQIIAVCNFFLLVLDVIFKVQQEATKGIQSGMVFAVVHIGKSFLSCHYTPSTTIYALLLLSPSPFIILVISLLIFQVVDNLKWLLMIQSLSLRFLQK